MVSGRQGKWLGLDRMTREERINQLVVMLGILAFRVLLDLAYPRIICRYYFHYGFVYDPGTVKMILSYAALFAVLAAFVPQVRLERPGSILLMMLLIMAFVPNMALFAGMNLPYSFFLMSVVFWLGIALFYSLGLVRRLRLRIRVNPVRAGAVKLPESSDLKKYWILYLAFLLVFAYSVRYNHGLSFRISLRDANVLRMAARGSVGGAIMRLLSWSGSIFFPMGIIQAVKNKKTVLFAVMLLGEMAAYSVNGTKTWLFTAALAFLMVIFIRKNSRIALLPWAFAAMAAVGLLLGTNNSVGGFFNNYFIRRVFFATSLNNHYWIDFFESHAKTFLTNGLLGWTRRFIQVPYKTNVAAIIGELYYGDPQSNASSGTIANAFSNFGWPGLAINAFCTVCVSELMDVVSGHRSPKVPILYFYPLIISASEYLVNGSIMTTMITYGYIPGLLLIVFLRHQGAFEEGGAGKLLRCTAAAGRRIRFRAR